MLSVKHIDHINMNVKSVAQTIEFYAKVFGFKVYEEGFYHEHPYAIIGLPSRAFLCIYEQPDLDVKENTISHLGYHVDNFEQVESNLKKLGVPINMSYSYPHSRSHYILDPSGYEIELTEKFGGDVHLSA